MGTEPPDSMPAVPPSVTRPQMADLAAEWRDSVGKLREAAAGVAEDLTALKHDLGVAISRLREAELWEADPDGAQRVLTGLAERLEAVEERVDARATQLVESQRRATTAAASSIRRLGAELQRLSAAPRRATALSLAGEPMEELEARLTDMIQRSTRELHQHVSRGLADATGGWDVVLDGLAELRKAVDQLRDAAPTTMELAAMVPHAVDGLPDQLADAVAERMAPTDARSAKQMQAVFEERLVAIEAAVLSVAGSGEQPAPTGGRTKRSDAERQLAATTTALRKEIEAFRKRIEGWGKPRTAPRLAEEVQRLEDHVSELGRAVEEQLAAKVARRVQASIDRRLRTLVGELPDHLRDTIAEAVREAATGSVAGVAREAVREAAEEAVRESLHQPASPEPPAAPEAPPKPEPDRRRLRFRR